MLILPETTPEEATVLAEHLRQLVMDHPLTIAPRQGIQVTISIGVAGDVGSQLQSDRLVDQADAAMYAAKSLGRNRTYRYRAVDDNAPVRRAPISAERRAAATAIGQWASDTAAEALASVLAPQPHHRGQPSDMIATLATGMALQMGLPQDEIERIRIASLLHDLGKLAVPLEILDKRSALSDQEWQAIGEHPRIGQVILEQASSLREAVPTVLHHHEHFNGGGYPHGLRGKEIPLGARIVAVADAYHAMIHDRPYRNARITRMRWPSCAPTPAPSSTPRSSTSSASSSPMASRPTASRRSTTSRARKGRRPRAPSRPGSRSAVRPEAGSGSGPSPRSRPCMRRRRRRRAEAAG